MTTTASQHLPLSTTRADIEPSMLALEYAGSILSQSTWFLPFAGEWAEFNGSAVKAALPDAQEQQLIQAISAGSWPRPTSTASRPTPWPERVADRCRPQRPAC